MNTNVLTQDVAVLDSKEILSEVNLSFDENIVAAKFDTYNSCTCIADETCCGCFIQ